MNSKGNIKVLPFDGKVLTKTTATSDLSIMSNLGKTYTSTVSTISAPVMTTCKLQEGVDKNIENMSVTPVAEISTVLMDGNENVTLVKDDKKCSVLADVLKTSGMVSSEYLDDIESQITQLTEVPQAIKHQIISGTNLTDTMAMIKEGNIMSVKNGIDSTNNLDEDHITAEVAGNSFCQHFVINSFIINN